MMFNKQKPSCEEMQQRLAGDMSGAWVSRAWVRGPRVSRARVRGARMSWALVSRAIMGSIGFSLLDLAMPMSLTMKVMANVSLRKIAWSRVKLRPHSTQPFPTISEP